MEVKVITLEQFTSFAQKHENRNFWQSEFYFQAKAAQGQEVLCVGGFENGKLCAAGGLLSYPTILGRKIYRCPRGFLIDYSKKQHVQDFFKGVQKVLKKRKGLYVRFDPYVEYKERDIDGNIVEHGVDHHDCVENLLSIGCKHKGFYRGYDESGEPRWMFVLDVKEKSLEQIREELSQQTRRDILRADKNGVKVRALKKEELPLFMNVMEHTEQRRGFDSPSLDYYEKMFEAGKEHITFLVAELDFQQYKQILENEKQQHVLELESAIEMLEAQPYSKKNIKKKRLEEEAIALADKKIKEIEEECQEKQPKVLAAAMFVMYGDEVVYLFSGAYNQYMKYYAPYMIQWEMITHAVEHKYERYNFYGISGNFEKDNEDYGVYRFKRGFQGRVVELIGDFELCIHPIMYKAYQGMKKIQDFIK